MSIDQSVFNQHMQEGFFQLASDDGRWGIHKLLSWPNVILWVTALSKRGCPDRYYFRFDLSGYPSTAPTACPWDNNTDQRLDNVKWPTGQRLVSKTFNYGWNLNALYVPCDRIAMNAHESWITQFPELWWQPHFKINVYLDFIHRLLNSSDYANS